MKVRRLELRSFMSHCGTDLPLPASGVVLVTGGNGAGKSSVIEAVATAFWGRTLRGTTPWREDQDGGVLVEADLAIAARHRKQSRSHLSWAAGIAGSDGHELPVEYESTSKAQEALESVVGTFDLWRRTHVFSSADAAHFTLATDGERKRLLESMLGLDRFDDALERCRADLKDATSRHSEFGRAMDRIMFESDAARRRREEAAAHLAELPPPETSALAKELADLDRIIKAYDGDLDGVRRSLREADSAAARAEAGAEHARCALAGFKGGACPTCREQLPRPRYQALQDEAHVADMKAVAARQDSAKVRSGLEADVRSMVEEKAALAARRVTLAARASAAKATEASRTRLAGVLASADKELADLGVRSKETIARLAAANLDLGELEAVERVLGLKGVRSSVLARALGGLEVCANAWLARIAGPNLRLKVRPYTEKRSGGVSDAIGLDVEGAGGGQGYRAASGGERRRIDVALLMALAEVAQAAHGQEPGTLFFDEVFDALDEAGVEAVAAALAELSATRAVVVITHSESVIGSIGAAERLHVADGRVSPVGW